jgi:hypothetical protein
LNEVETDALKSYIESRKGRQLLWVWLREPQERLKSLQMLKVKK